MPASQFVGDDISSAPIEAFLAALGGSTAVTTGITAHAGGGQSPTTALTNTFNRVDTVATANDSVGLPLGAVGDWVVVTNNSGSNSMQVFGSGTDTINGVATATGVAQAAGKTALYWCDKAAPGGNWMRLLSA